MINSFLKNFKLYWRAFGTLDTRSQIVFFLGGIFVLLMFMKIFFAAGREVSDYIEANKYGVTKGALIELKIEATSHGLVVARYIDELKIAKSVGFDDYKTYKESQKLGTENFEQYSAAKELGRTKEQWKADKEKIKSEGLTISQYVTKIKEENRKMKEENRKMKEEQGRLQAKKWEWENRCERFAAAKNECAVASSVSKCIEVKVGFMDFEMGKIYCDGNKPNWFLMGEKNFN